MKMKNSMKGTKKRTMKMSTGLILFSSLVFFLMATSPVMAQQCGCDGCHGNPPTTSDKGGPTGLVGLGLGLGTSSGAHDHFTKFKQNLTCENCHFGGMLVLPIVDFKLQIGFYINGKSGAGMIYDGLASFADPKWAYEATNGSTLTQNGTLKCFNVYCHGGGIGGTNNTGGITKSLFLNNMSDPRPVEESLSPAWNNITPIGCNYCHGIGTTDGRPSYPSDNPKRNGHMGHKNVKCSSCHYATTHDDVSIYNVTKHHNGIYDVVPDPTASTANGPINFTYTYDAGGGKCTNVSCHGGDPYIGYWGSPTMGSTGIGATLNVTKGSGCYQIDASATPVSGSASQSPPYIYDFDWGDGTTTTGTSSTAPLAASHSYIQGGTYTIMFNYREKSYVSGSSASASVTPQTVNIPPVPSSTVSSSGMTVTLTDLSSDADYTICNHAGAGSIAIDWNDGSVTNQSIDLTDKPSNKIFQHTYTFPGTFARTFYLTHSIRDNAGMLVAEANSIPVTVAPSTITVSGKITHSGGSGYTPGQAFSNLSVEVHKKDGSYVTSVITKSDGTYTATSIPAGQHYDVIPVKNGFTFTPPSADVYQDTTGLNFVGKP
jgi:predicted CxxxxCH...CXXCH cytochrome family protein